MRQTKQCPKCGSRDILYFANDGFMDSSSKGIAVGLTVFSNVNVERYICCGCGYTEQWVAKQDIEELRRSRKAMPIG
ncbi:MAG: hypothetical protein IJ055_01335 [Oscillospiraceae bacterium]|nr:hypothetical protein [Oscillospiraceae bacterium]